MNRRRFILGAVALTAAAVVAVVRPGQDPRTQVVSAVQMPTTTTTIDPTRPTITVYVLGQKQVIPLPPGVPDPATIPPGEGVLNCLHRLDSINGQLTPSPSVPPGIVVGPEQDPRCNVAPPEVPGGLPSVSEILARLGVTTTTTP